MKALIWALPVLALMTLAGCRHQTKGTADSVALEQEQSQIVVEGFTDTVEIEMVPVEEEPQPVAKAKPSPIVEKGKNQRNNGKPETIYVETEGAQGRVWGHVTMKGDRGSGTIHDWDENTLSVTVTRHGNELFAVDQNSRQYVFKLK